MECKSRLSFVLVLVVAFGSVVFGEQLDYAVRGVSFADVKIADEFWSGRIETNRKVSIPYAFGKCEENGRMDNFDIAAGVKEGKHKGGYPFDDTDVYKILEGAAYALTVQDDPHLDKYVDELIAKIAAAQEDDGYIYTCRTNSAEHLRGWMGDERWSKLNRSHELYNAGHMYEAAVAHYEATGKRNFLDVAIKNADLMCKTFNDDGLRLPPGHQIIEMGLARLYRATGQERYLDLAKFLLDERGRQSKGRKLWGPYNQDHKTVAEQDEAVGHAVRATYMYAGIADVAALTGDAAYIKAIDKLWDNVVSKKLYITGGVGATGHGEAFGKNYELPNMSAYCETCAAIGNVYWNHRLFLLHADAGYVDVLERTLYNGLISGVSLDGKLFFYPNPLASQGQHQRSSWFGCACCPGNVTRFIASVPGYLYAHKGDVVYVNLFAAGRATIKTEKQNVTIEQQTRYPWDGKVTMKVEPERTGAFGINIRIPGWARNKPLPSDLYRFVAESDEIATVKVNGRKVPLNMEKGYACIRGKWKKGDEIELNLPMPIRRVLAHEKVEADRGRVAVQRGPIVYCAEWCDNAGGHVVNLMLTDDAKLRGEYRKDMFDGVVTIGGEATALHYGEDHETIVHKKQKLTMIPYYAWAHRGKGEMAVWLGRTMEGASPLAGPTIASTSKVTTSGGKNRSAINDQHEPKNSIDHSVQFFHWWPKKGTAEWVQYEFEKTEEVSTVEVYWFDDTGIGECRLPASWKILYRVGDEWKPVWTEQEWGVEKDKFNKVVFETVKTDALRMEVKLPEKFAAGIHEWRVK